VKKMDLGTAAEGIAEVSKAAMFLPPLLGSLCCIPLMWIGWAGRERNSCAASLCIVGASQIWLIWCGAYAAVATDFRHYVGDGVVVYYVLLTLGVVAWVIVGLRRCQNPKSERRRKSESSR
jgi:hypothetical protein